VPGLYRTADEKRRLETRNGAIQFLAVLNYAAEWKPGESELTSALVRELQRLAINQIYSCAGSFRDGPVQITGVLHQPPEPVQIPELVESMCTYVNRGWDGSPIHLAAYLMWRVNWIHPFFGGNGRTSRAMSYLILCARLGFTLPGTPTIPEQIVAQREPYYEALRDADAAWENGKINVTKMETLLENLLATQLLAIHNRATGRQAELDRATSRPPPSP
jgi:Fic family protein